MIGVEGRKEFTLRWQTKCQKTFRVLRSLEWIPFSRPPSKVRMTCKGVQLNLKKEIK